MRYCIPNELFNRIPYPVGESDEVPLDGIYRSIAYKLPKAEEVEVRRETWHTLCDFCGRTGALREKLSASAGSSQIPVVSPNNRRFMRIVGAEARPTEGNAVVAVPETGFSLEWVGEELQASFSEDYAAGSAALCCSMQPKFSDATANPSTGRWEPTVPQYMIDRYGECVAHGALARLYAMRGDGAMARMHATAYNNDLNRLSFGLITSGMRKHLLIDIEDWLVNTSANGNG